MTAQISFFAAGDPKGQPRPRAFARKFGNKFSARVYDPGTAEGWKSQIAIAAREYRPERPIEGPLRVDLAFWFTRPKNHFRTGKHADQLKPGHSIWHTTKPDRDNLEKATIDALTQLGFWQDDCQICAGDITKRWVIGGIWPSSAESGCLITIQPIVERVA